MAYQGTTSTANAPNVPRMMVGMMGSTEASPNSSSPAQGKNLWFYNSTHALSDIVGAGFFTDGDFLGMQQGDVLMSPTYTTQSATGFILVFGVLGSTNTTAGFNLTTVGTMTSTFA